MKHGYAYKEDSKKDSYKGYVGIVFLTIVIIFGMIHDLS